MTLESQVVSLPLAQKLKELGVWDVGFLYCWVLESDGSWSLMTSKEREKRSYFIRDEWCSAPTTAELGELLPSNFATNGRGYALQDPHREGPRLEDVMRHFKHDPNMTEADGRAQIMCILLEHNLTKGEEGEV